MNEIIEKEKINIEDMIYEIRGVQVMLSSDVAKLYQVETRRINEVIKRNINRFPDTFCFQLTSDEIEKLSSRSQFAILNNSNNMRGQHFKYLPYVLTDNGRNFIIYDWLYGCTSQYNFGVYTKIGINIKSKDYRKKILILLSILVSYLSNKLLIISIIMSCS